MTIDEIMRRYLPMERKTCYLLLSVLEPCDKDKVCQTVSELSNGEFDFEENLTRALNRLTESLICDGLIVCSSENGSLRISDLGMKLLVCELSRINT